MMGKKAIAITIESSVHDQIKDKGLNISALCEDALREVVRTFEYETKPEDCQHKWTWPFSVSTGLAKECVKCGTIRKVVMETHEETMNRIKEGSERRSRK